MSDASVHDVPAAHLPFLMDQVAGLIGTGQVADMLRRAADALTAQAGEIHQLKAKRDEACAEYYKEAERHQVTLAALDEAGGISWDEVLTKAVAERDALRAQVAEAHGIGRCACGWGAAGLVDPCIGHALAIKKAVADAVAIEREACARLGDACPDSHWGPWVAAAIRARGETQT